MKKAFKQKVLELWNLGFVNVEQIANLLDSDCKTINKILEEEGEL
jgi:hypothetical protein